MQQQLVLASSSSQRLALLNKINIIPTKVVSPNIDESIQAKERPFALVNRLSLAKLNCVKNTFNNSFIIAADTIVARGALILGKPKDIKEAEHFLNLLSGRKHKVITGISVCNPNNKIVSKVISTTVAFKKLEVQEIINYLASKEWLNKAGGYTIDGYAEIFIKQIIGSYSNILGLPLLTACNLLKGLGYLHKWPPVAVY